MQAHSRNIPDSPSSERNREARFTNEAEGFDTESHAMKTPSMLMISAALCALSLPVFSDDKPPAGAAVVASTEPGKGTVAEVVEVKATVEAIDRKKHHLTIKGPNGKVSSLEVGPDVRNFEQIKVGDRVAVRYAQALTLTLMKNGKKTRSRTETVDGDRSPAGGRPAGVVGQRIEVTADVVAVNRKARTVTLHGPEHEVVLDVHDPEQLKLVKVGDQVHAVYTEAVALSVEPASRSGK